MEKFIPLRDFILAKQIIEKPKEEEIKNSLGIFLTSEIEQKDKPTNRLTIKTVGDHVLQKDLLKEGTEAMFDFKGNRLELNGEEFLLVREGNLFGVIEREG